MALKTIEVEVCDTCEDPKRPVRSFEIIEKDSGKKVAKALCPQHSRPLQVLLGNAKPTGRPPAKAVAARKAAGRRVVAKKS